MNGFDYAELKPKEMADQLLKASKYIDSLRLHAAPDYGLVMMNVAGGSITYTAFANDIKSKVSK